ncbi:unnamed protein product [Phytophthora fragariaefolia]|uniref:Unnamed protein product n=1 Tax=Phytophthora fragariaefolia TaxID=1490495 RepID=A0A9W6YMC2_9STRA|nr:unnamed protein product [Phytophthora fragariaefolia]
MHPNTLAEAGRTMLWASGLPDRYWGDAVKYASCIRNRALIRANGDYRAPLDVVTGKAPKVAHILRFRSTCTAHVAHKKAASVKRRAAKAVVIGISETQKGYRLFLSRTRKIITSADVKNIDHLDVHEKETQDALKELHGENGPSPTEPAIPGPTTEQSRHFKRQRRGRVQGQPIQRRHDSMVFGSRKKKKLQSHFAMTQELIEEVAGSATLLLSEATTAMTTARSIEEAKQTPEWPQWKAAIEKELRDLQANGMWESGDDDARRAHCVLLVGISDQRAFSGGIGGAVEAPTPTWRRAEHLCEGQLGSANPDETSEGTYMPVRLILAPEKGAVGFKQSCLVWNKEINSFMLSIGFARCKLDPCLYTRRHPGNLTVLGLYVDDVIIVAEDDDDSDWAIHQLEARFDIRDMGDHLHRAHRR